ncbi:ClpXP protease specificity-enhancing factor SspB [Haliangium sp.]|uniref:ClpXP protease specificity-enhancing factor SspB n=1 Tax=Haliangium sp. TaxID=2663208 RepID=UPI003D0A521F
MLYDDRSKLARLQSVLEAVLEHKLAASLELIEDSLHRWRQGELHPLDVHNQMLEHSARVDRIAKRLTRASAERLRAVLREAFDLDLVSRELFVELLDVSPEEVEPGPSVDDDEAWRRRKREQVQELLDQGPILVNLDTRAAGVAVPERFRGQARLVLRFGFQLSPPIRDLALDEDGIRGTLTFGGQPFTCVVPWSALYLVVPESDGQGPAVWAEDMPDEILAELSAAGNAAEAEPAEADSWTPPAETPGKKTRASHLKLVD